MRVIHAKKNVFGLVAVVVCFVFGGCCTGRITADATGVVAGNSYAVGRLEATVAALDGTVTSSRERIAVIIETSRGIADGVERIAFLFDQYEYEVKRILNEIDRIRNEAETSGKTVDNSSDTFSDFRGGSVGSADPAS